MEMDEIISQIQQWRINRSAETFCVETDNELREVNDLYFNECAPESDISIGHMRQYIAENEANEKVFFFC